VERNNRILVSVAAVLLLVVIFSGWLDDHGRDYTEQGLKRTLFAYGLARGLNGVISVAQGTEVAVQPVGVGVTFTPGQILDPINDLVERFSWIVLASGVSLGAQRILLSMTAWLWFSGLVAACLLISLLLLWRKIPANESRRRFAYKLTAVLLVLRLAVPVIALLNEGIYQLFLAPQYEDSIARLETATSSIERIQQVAPSDAENGLMERARRMMQNASSALDLDKQLTSLKQAVADFSEYALNMIVVFVLQTLVFPLFFLWLAYKFIGNIFKW
jgi:hypothetical protein